VSVFWLKGNVISFRVFVFCFVLLAATVLAAALAALAGAGWRWGG
jgi:hypothetical protein